MHTIDNITHALESLFASTFFLAGVRFVDIIVSSFLGGEAFTVYFAMFKLLTAYCLCFIADSFVYINFFAETASIF